MATDSRPAARLARAQHRKPRPPRHRRALITIPAVILALIGIGLGISLSSSPGHSRASGKLAQSTKTSTSASSTSTASTSNSAVTSTTTAQPSTTTTLVALVSPSDVTVEVLNGVGAPGAAGSAANELEMKGFDVNGTGDADSFTYTASVIAYPPGMEAEAETLAHYVNGPASLSSDDNLSGQVLDLVIGSTFQGVLNG